MEVLFTWGCKYNTDHQTVGSGNTLLQLIAAQTAAPGDVKIPLVVPDQRGRGRGLHALPESGAPPRVPALRSMPLPAQGSSPQRGRRGPQLAVRLGGGLGRPPPKGALEARAPERTRRANPSRTPDMPPQTSDRAGCYSPPWPRPYIYTAPDGWLEPPFHLGRNMACLQFPPGTAGAPFQGPLPAGSAGLGSTAGRPVPSSLGRRRAPCGGPAP